MTDAVIFDLDGTLIDSAHDIHAAANRVMENQGLEPFSFAEMQGFVGHGAAVLIERCLKARQRDGDPAFKKRTLEEFLVLYEDAVHLTTVYPNVPACLTQLKDMGLRLS